MKVLLMTRKFPGPSNLGAVAGLLWDVTNELVDQGIEVDVIAGSNTRPGEEHPRPDLEVHRFRYGNRLKQEHEIFSIISGLRKKVDLIHIHDILPMGPDVIRHLSKIPMPKFWTLHNLSPICMNSVLWPPCSLNREGIISEGSGLCYIDRKTDCRSCFRRGPIGTAAYLRYILSSKLIQRAAKEFNLITPSRSAKRILVKAWGEQVTVLPNAIRLREVSPSEKIGQLRKIFFGGRIVPEKGLDLLIEAIKEFSDTSLYASGSGRKKYLERLDRLSQELDVDYHRGDWIPRERFLDMLPRFDTCVVPSRGFEVFGMIALDAEMAGLPLILADSGGLREVGSVGKNAIYHKRDDPESLASAIALMISDPTRKMKYSKMSRKIAEARFSIFKHVNLLLKIYENGLESAVRKGS